MEYYLSMETIKPHKFRLRHAYFDQRSFLHGKKHTYRVMYHVMAIGSKAGLKDEIFPAFCAAFIHDMARTHDGYCTEHGQRSAEIKLPQFADFFITQGLNEHYLEAISLAVTNHSLHEEVDAAHQYYRIVALLKDADALDRIRLCEDNLDANFLRFPETFALYENAKKLFFATDKSPIDSFSTLLKIAKQIGL
jgi:hypothetical protein